MVIYQMGKVGSESVYRSLRASTTINCLHHHSLNPAHLEYEARNHNRPSQLRAKAFSLFVASQWAADHRRWKFITLVREPISRNLSAFFQNRMVDSASASQTRAETFINEFRERYPHYVPLVWFDREVLPVLGIDVYAHSFDPKKGSRVIRGKRADLLVLKTQLPDEEKSRQIADFLSLDCFRLRRHNEGKSKHYHRVYNAVKAMYRPSVEEAAYLLDSRFTRHFYSKAEREQLKAKWLASPVG